MIQLELEFLTLQFWIIVHKSKTHCTLKHWHSICYAYLKSLKDFVSKNYLFQKPLEACIIQYTCVACNLIRDISIVYGDGSAKVFCLWL